MADYQVWNIINSTQEPELHDGLRLYVSRRHCFLIFRPFPLYFPEMLPRQAYIFFPGKVSPFSPLLEYPVLIVDKKDSFGGVLRVGQAIIGTYCL